MSNPAGSLLSLSPALSAWSCSPASAPRGGVVVIQEAFGVNAFVQATCERFAARGYAAIAPDYYHGDRYAYADRERAIARIDGVDDDEAMRETALAVDHLQHAGAKRVAVVGFCMGGRLAFLANATLGDRVAATVSFYGGGIAPAQSKGRRKPLLDRVPDLGAPALLINGAQDASILPDENGRLAQALTAANKRFVLAVLPDAPHAFATFDRESYRKPAADAAWRLADDWLAAALDG